MRCVAHDITFDILDFLGNWDADTLGGAAVFFPNNDVLCHVHETTGEVARVGGTQRGVGQALAGAVGVIEVLQHRQAFPEGGFDRAGDVITLGVHHHALHAGQRPDLTHVTGSTGLHNHGDWVIVRVELFHGLTHRVGGVLPQFDQAFVPVAGGEGTLLPVFALDLLGLGLVGFEHFFLVVQHQHVGHGDGDTGAGSPIEAGILHLVHGLGNGNHGVFSSEVVNDVAQHDFVGAAAFPHHDTFKVRVVPGQQLVEEDAAQGGFRQPGLAVLPTVGEVLRLDVGRGPQMGDAHLDLGLQTQHAAVFGHDGFRHGGVHAGGGAVGGGGPVGALATEFVLTLVHGEVVQAGHHVQAGHGQRLTGCRRQDVIGCQHEDAGFRLRLRRQRQVHGHLVAVKVGVEGFTGQRVQLDGLAFDEFRLEGLDTQAVQGGGTVEHHRVFGDGFFQHIPHLGPVAFHHALGGLDVLGEVVFDQPLHDERLEQFQCHEFRQAALVQFELRADDNNGTPGVVHTLTKQVLAEPALLALEQVGQGFQGSVARASDGATPTTVVEQGVDGFLQHALLVIDDDLGGAEVDHALEAVVTVNDAPVQVIEVGGGEAATVELHHGAQLRGDDRNAVEHHAGGIVAGALERGHHLEAFEGPHFLLALTLGDDGAQLFGLRIKIEVPNECLNCFGTHATGEVVFVAVDEFLVDGFVDNHLLGGQFDKGLPNLLQAVNFPLHALPNVLHFLVGSVLHFTTRVRLGTSGL